MRHAGVAGWLFFAWASAGVAGAHAGEAARQPVLPPETPWEGGSRSLMATPSDPWITPAERSGLTRTPRYDETLDWLKRLVGASPELRLISLGKSPEGRDIWMVVASRERAFTPHALRASGKPTVLAQAGIHAGEIDGKDAGLMLLRDLTAGGKRKELLQGANFLFVPILNVDGHERFSSASRINQRGPVESGWRTNARNLNLNRDYSKLDAPETRALVRVLDAWDPDLYLDLHVTDGADYQYDVTFGHNTTRGFSPAIGRWLDQVATPALDARLVAMGHIPGRLWAAGAVDPLDPRKGVAEWVTGPRFSNGYGDARHLPTLLVETHSLKPYPQRVLGTYVLLVSALELVAREASTLRAAVGEDRARRAEQVPVEFKAPGAPSGTVDYLGVDWRREDSPVSGAQKIVFTGKPLRYQTPLFPFTASAHARRPRAYWVPAAWTDVIERLTLHGITMERLNAPREAAVVISRIVESKLAPEPFEGRVVLTPRVVSEPRNVTFPAGSVRVSTDQALGDLAVLLLDPGSPDSFLQWGFFLETLQPTEYVEAYVMEPMGERMLAEDPALKAEFERKLRDDPAFAMSAPDRLQWLYRRTPFYDERALVYPVAREP